MLPIADALAVRLDDDFLNSPRYVLVFDAHDNFVGVISRRDLLRGLAPGYRSMKQALEARNTGHGTALLFRFPVGVAAPALKGGPVRPAVQDPGAGAPGPPRPASGAGLSRDP